MEERSLGRYRLTRLLGRGGMGEVYLAHDPTLGRDVALKVLPEELREDEGRRARFLREARAIAALNHPNVATIHEIGVADGRDFIALEHVDGASLESADGERAKTLTELLGLALPLAEGLAYAHSRGVVHRDLKPANVVVSSLGHPKLLDFGLAKLLEDEGSDSLLTQEGDVLGTPAYMSPEQAQGKPVDERSDVFSFGSLLYRLATGGEPFAGANALEVLEAVSHAEPRSLAVARPDLPDAMVRIATKAMRKDPAERYQHMSDVVADLKHLKRESETAAVPPVRAKPKPWLGAAIVAAAVLGTALTWILSLGGVEADPRPAAADDALAVMYFENLVDPADADRMGSMLATLLATELAGSSGLEVLSSQRVFDVARQLGRGDGTVDRTIASEVARRAGVGTMILGQVARAGDRWIATTELVEVATGRTLDSQKATGASLEDIFAMAEELGHGVRSALAASTDADVPALTERLTDSVEALQAYEAGLSLMYRWDMARAEQQFAEAIRIDPDFALAYYCRFMTLRWFGRPGSTEALRELLEHVERLPPIFRRICRALDVEERRGFGPAIELHAAALAEFPDERDVLYWAGEAFVHSATHTDLERAVDLFARTLEIDPSFHLVYEHLANGSRFLGRGDRVEAWLQEWSRTQPEMVQYLNGFGRSLEGNFDEALAIDPGTSTLFSNMLRLSAGRWDEVETTDTPYARRAAQPAIADTFRGRFEEAARAYEEERAQPLQLDRDDLDSWTRAGVLQRLSQVHLILGNQDAARGAIDELFGLYPDSYKLVYLAGRFEARQGELEAARAKLDRLRRLSARGHSVMASLYLDGLAGEVALADERWDEARTLLHGVTYSERVDDDVYVYNETPVPLFAEGLALACRGAGDPAGEAEALRTALDAWWGVNHPTIQQRARYRLGVLELEAGREAAGRALLREFLELWGEADLDEVRDARARLGP